MQQNRRVLDVCAISRQPPFSNRTTKAEVFDRVIQNDEGQRYLALESTILLKEDVLLLWVINKGLNSATLNLRQAIEQERKESTSMIMFFAILDFSLPRRLELSSCDANDVSVSKSLHFRRPN